ncbi:MAG: hypothetical protein HOM01_14895 [Kordiimonadaceae bacterium]|nr:hypothetical protein [Kordiimonadaceae bacterium]
MAFVAQADSSGKPMPIASFGEAIRESKPARLARCAESKAAWVDKAGTVVGLDANGFCSVCGG